MPHGRIKSIDVSEARALPGVYGVYTGEDIPRSCPIPITGRPSTTSRSSRSNKVRYVGEPVAVVLADDPHVAEQAAQLIVAEYEELPAVYDEVEAADYKVLVHDELKPAGTFADLKHLKGARTPISRSTTSCAAATSTRPSPQPHKSSSTLQDPEGAAPFVRALVALADYRDDAVTITPPRKARPSCASRSRACSAGPRTACA